MTQNDERAGRLREIIGALLHAESRGLYKRYGESRVYVGVNPSKVKEDNLKDIPQSLLISNMQQDIRKGSICEINLAIINVGSLLGSVEWKGLKDLLESIPQEEHINNPEKRDYDELLANVEEGIAKAESRVGVLEPYVNQLVVVKMVQNPLKLEYITVPHIKDQRGTLRAVTVEDINISGPNVRGRDIDYSRIKRILCNKAEIWKQDGLGNWPRGGCSF